jgi:DnaJ-class molecular chaperone
MTQSKNPFEILGLDPETATQELAITAWRRLASQHHPDKGGDPSVFSEMRKAYKDVLQELSQPKICEKCFGSGRIPIPGYIGTIKVFCPTCQGSGFITRGI